MKKYLNTLYITTPNAYLFKEGETVVVRVDSENKARLPVHNLDGIICFGSVSMSPFLMAHCAENNLTVSFLTEYGRFLARVHGAVAGNVLLRREQYRQADDVAKTSSIARSLLVGKIVNSRAVIRRAMRDHSDKVSVPDMDRAESRLSQYARRLETQRDMNELRGIEGDAAASYFEVFNHMITSQKDFFVMKGRNRRPPLDPVNALLSFIYTLLVHDCRSALEGVGLDPYVGYLHVDRPGRPSLALDLMEEFRSFLADRLVLSLINRCQVNSKSFHVAESGSVVLKDADRKEVLVAWQKRKQEEITHPYIGEKVQVGLLTHIQAKLLSRYLRGELDAYPPFIWK